MTTRHLTRRDNRSCRKAGSAVSTIGLGQCFSRVFLVWPALLVLSVCPLLGQVEAMGRPSGRSETRLFDLVTGSEFCAVVTVHGETPLGRRLSPEELLALKDLSDALGGVRYQMKIVEHLCKRDNLATAFPTVFEEPKNQFYVFKAFNVFVGYDFYTLNETYLIFAEPLKDQARLVQEYKLESGTTYYHAFKGRQGLFLLSQKESLQMLEMTRTFCEAIRPPALPEKLSRLRVLLESESAPAELKASARKAIETIEAIPRP